MWGIIELMGHRKHHGLITEVTFAGVQMIRVQVPFPEKQTEASGAEVFAETHLYAPGSLYVLHEETEQAVRDRLAPFKGYALPERTEVDTERPDPIEWDEPL